MKKKNSVSGWWIVVLMVVVVSLGLFTESQSAITLEEWAAKAPLERVFVPKGQTAETLAKARVPAEVRAHGDMNEAVRIIGQRQGKKLGTVAAETSIQLPIPFEEWVNK